MEINRKPLRYLKTAGVFLLILFSISSSSILVLVSGATALACAFWRVFLASVILWGLRGFRGGVRRFVIDRHLLGYSVVSGALLAMHFLLWMESLFVVPVAVSTTVVVTYPLLSVVVDYCIFKERITVLQIVGLVVGFVGVLLFMHPQILADDHSFGVLLAFSGALGATGYFSIGRFVRQKLDVLSYTITAYTSTSLLLLLYAVISNANLVNYSPQTYVSFVLLAVVPMICGHTLINFLLRHMKTSIATSIALGEPIGASLLAYLILQQQIDVPTALVMTLVLTSIALTISQELKKGHPLIR